MKHFPAAIVALILSMCCILSSCSVRLPSKSNSNNTLNFGVESIDENLNPFYADENSFVMSQLFESVQRSGYNNRLENLCGSITYEFLKGGKVKYTVSIDDNLKFSDGTYATIDDVIFYYYVLADATYDGRMKDWYQNDIQGLKAYYYDDKKYSENIASIKEEYEDKSEQQKKIKDYIKSNYSDGISVSEISGIKKINAHACTVVFNSFNINSISQINPVIVSKSAYGSGYVKGKADVVKLYKGEPAGTGPYVFSSKNEKSDTLVMNANRFYHNGIPQFETLKVIDLSKYTLTASKALETGKIDGCEVPASAPLSDFASNDKYRFQINDLPYYYAISFNCKTLNANIRKGIASLADWTAQVKGDLGSYYSNLYRPLSLKFDEYPDNVTEAFYKTDSAKADEYFKNAGYKKSGEFLVNEEDKKLTLKACCLSDGNDTIFKIADSLALSLKNKGITLKVECKEKDEYQKSLNKKSFDIWFGPVYDGKTCDLYPMFFSSGKENYFGFSDETVDSMIKSIRTEPDYSSRIKQTSSLLSELMKQLPMLPLYQQKSVTIYNLSIIDEKSIPLDSDSQGSKYIIKTLRPVNN